MTSIPFGWSRTVLPKLEAALRDVRSEKAQFRRNAAMALGRADEDQREKAIGAVAVLLDDKDAAVRLEAIVAASKLRAGTLAPRVERFLSSDRRQEKLAALDFLSRCGDESHVAAVAALLSGEKDDQVRCMALEAISWLDPDRCLALIQGGMRDAESQAFPVLQTMILLLSEIGTVAEMDALARFLDHPSIAVRVEAAHVMAMMRGRAAPAGVRDVLLDAAELIKDWRLRELALEGLCRTGGEAVHRRAREKFGKLFMSRGERIYWAAMVAAAGEPKGGVYLERIYGGRNIPLAARVLDAAGLCGLKEWIPVMEENVRRFADGKSDDFLFDSIAALAKMGCPESLEILRAFEARLREGNPEVADAIREELEVAEMLVQAASDGP
jgi:hypothetical protein